MALKFTGPIAATRKGHGLLEVKSIDVAAFGGSASPVEMFDDFVVGDVPFAPHPHAGFSAVSYIFEDSPGSARSRDSLGGDVVVGPGGLVWSQAARGMLHEELPADRARKIHGLQIFVNLSAAAKDIPAEVFALDGPEVPVWSDADGNSVRVVTGRFEDVASPVPLAEPCDLLDMTVAGQLDFAIPAGRNMFLYCESGAIRLSSGSEAASMSAGQALTAAGRGGLTFVAVDGPAHLVLVSGMDLRDPVVAHGPFIMTGASAINDAVARYQRGEMGALAPSPR